MQGRAAPLREKEKEREKKRIEPPASGNDADARRRLIDGLAAAVEEKGYVATTIADIVRHARVSKRTFYETFADKEECFLAGYRIVCDDILAIIEAAAQAKGTWQERTRFAAMAYLGSMEQFPALAWTYTVEIYAVGPKALAMRREMHRRFAEQLRTLALQAKKEDAALKALSPLMAVAIVGGIHELVLAELESGKKKLVGLVDTATELFTAVVTGR